MIISGHIHEYQIIPGVVYVGTFFQQNHGESEDKAIMLLTLTRSESSTNIPVPNIPMPTVDGVPTNVLTVVNRLKSRDVDVGIERIRLKTIPVMKTIRLSANEIASFGERLPIGNVRKGMVVPGGVLTRVVIRADDTEKIALRSNPHYQSMASQVDSIQFETSSVKLSLAGQIVKNSGLSDITKVSLEQVVLTMLHDDMYTHDTCKRDIFYDSPL